MSMMLPGHLVDVLDILGFQWPLADEDKIYDSARAWRDYAGEVEHVIADADRACRDVLRDNEGLAISAFERHWQRLGGQGDLGSAADAALVVSEALEIFGDAVVAMKAATIAQLTATAAAVTASVASAIFTAGLSTVAGAAAVQAARLAIRKIIQEALQTLVKRVIPKLRGHAAQLFGGIVRRLRRYLESVRDQLRRQLRQGNPGGSPGKPDKSPDGDHRPRVKDGQDVLSDFGGLVPGRQVHVRMVRDADELRGLFDDWTRAAEPLEPRGGKVPEVYRLPDGTIVQWRLSSASGGETIDIFPPGKRGLKVHINE